MVVRRLIKNIMIGLAIVCGAAAPAVADTAADCPHEASLKSPASVTASKLSFHNSAKDLRKVFWLDFGGGRKFYSDVAPGQTYDVSTFAGHTWVVTNGAAKCVSIVVASAAPLVVDVGPVTAAPVVAQPMKPKRTPPTVATAVHRDPASACSRQEVYSSSMGRCIPKAAMCSKNQVYSSSMAQCISKAAMCSSSQVYSSSMGQCIPKVLGKAAGGPSQKIMIKHGCPYNLDKECTKSGDGKLSNCRCVS